MQNLAGNPGWNDPPSDIKLQPLCVQLPEPLELFRIALVFAEHARIPGRIRAEGANRELALFPVASIGQLTNHSSIIERSLYPFRAAAAPMIDIGMRARRSNDACEQRNFRSPLSGRLYDFCTIRANALEVIDSRRI